MSDLTGELLAAVVAATPERKEAALKVLRGEGIPPPPHEVHETERFVSLKECGRLLGVHPTTLWRWRIPGHELGGRTRYRMSDIEVYLKSKEFKRRAAVLMDERDEWRAARRKPEVRCQKSESGENEK